MVFGHLPLVFQKPEVAILDFKMALGDSFWALSVILVEETLILGEIWSFSADFQTPEVTILQFKMLSKFDLWLQCIITIPEIPILGGIWSFAAVFKKPEVAILKFKTKWH